MFFLQTQQPPVIVTWNKLKIVIPKFLMEDLIQFGTEVQQERIDKVTAGMADVQRRDYINFRMVDPTIEDLKNLIRTPAGAKRVLEICLKKAKVEGGRDLAGEEIKSIVNSGVGRLSELAWYLSDLTEGTLSTPLQDQQDTGGDDPLPQTDSAGQKS